MRSEIFNEENFNNSTKEKSLKKVFRVLLMNLIIFGLWNINTICFHELFIYMILPFIRIDIFKVIRNVYKVYIIFAIYIMFDLVNFCMQIKHSKFCFSFYFLTLLIIEIYFLKNKIEKKYFSIIDLLFKIFLFLVSS